MDKTMMTFAMKRTTKLGCWNVRSLRQVGRLKQVCAEMINYDLDIRGIGKSWADASELAQKRDKWRKIVVALCSSGNYRK